MVDNVIFTIDVGTRKMAAIVSEKEEDGRLKVIGSSYRVHHDRALIDGQVEDIEETSKHIRLIKEKLEERLGIKLTKVNLAVAGRGLKSIKVKDGIDISGEEVTADDMKQAVLQALSSAQKQFPSAGLVGYSINSYFVDGYMTQNPKYRIGRRLEVEIIATFLPEQPVYALMKSAELAGLEVSFITLEPIAAITSTIPPEIRYFHLALVDIGGGTSDISISKDGKIVGYDVIPIAGDEITEALSNRYLLPFTTAERIKIKLTADREVATRDILGNKVVITRDEYIETIRPVVDDLTSQIAEKILSLGGDTPRAVILVGGGSRTPLIREMLAEKLSLPLERVGIRFPMGRGFKILPRRLSDPAWAVAVGTTLLAAEHQGVPLIKVTLNGIPISLFSLTSPTVKEAMARLGLSLKSFYGKPSPGTVITVDDKLVSFPGMMGKPPKITVSGKEASLDTPLHNGDDILIIKGENAPIYIPTADEVINKVAPKVFIDGNPVSIDFTLTDRENTPVSEISDGETYHLQPRTVEDLIISLQSQYGKLIPESELAPETPLSQIQTIYLKTIKKEHMENISETQDNMATDIIHIISSVGNKDIPYTPGDIVASVLSKVPDMISALMSEGKKITIYINGTKAGYSAPLKAGDTIELRLE